MYARAGKSEKGWIVTTGYTIYLPKRGRDPDKKTTAKATRAHKFYGIHTNNKTDIAQDKGVYGHSQPTTSVSP